jgi:hypothetical protein
MIQVLQCFRCFTVTYFYVKCIYILIYHAVVKVFHFSALAQLSTAHSWAYQTAILSTSHAADSRSAVDRKSALYTYSSLHESEKALVFFRDLETATSASRCVVQRSLWFGSSTILMEKVVTQSGTEVSIIHILVTARVRKSTRFFPGLGDCD